MTSEIERNAAEIRSRAAGCKTVAQLWRKFPEWRDVQHAHAANRILNLGLLPHPDKDQAAQKLVAAGPKKKE